MTAQNPACNDVIDGGHEEPCNQCPAGLDCCGHCVLTPADDPDSKD